MKTAIFLTALATAFTLNMSSADASTTTFDFNDRNATDNSSKTYARNGYTFDNWNGSNSSRCFVDDCFLEPSGKQTNLTEDNGITFDLVSFYINFQGNDPNAVSILAWDDVGHTDNTGADYTSTIALAGAGYDGSGDFKVYTTASTPVQHTTALVKQVGYWIVFNNTLDNYKQFGWDYVDSKQVRVDCVTVSPDGMNVASGSLNSCTGSVPINPVPVPASMWLMVVGLGGLAAMRRKKRMA